MDIEKRKFLPNMFFNTQFNYCPLIWMLQGCCNDNNTKYLHERSLTYHTKNFYKNMDQFPFFVKMLKKLRLRCLKSKIFEPRNSKRFVCIVKCFVAANENHYDIENQNDFRRPLMIRTNNRSVEIISHLGSKLWNITDRKLKEAIFIDIFKKPVRKQIPEDYP